MHEEELSRRAVVVYSAFMSPLRRQAFWMRAARFSPEEPPYGMVAGRAAAGTVMIRPGPPGSGEAASRSRAQMARSGGSDAS